MTDQEPKSKSNVDHYLDRRDKENDLLNTRTTLILLTNSIAAVAVGRIDSVIIATIVTISMIFIDALWLKCSFEACRGIRLFNRTIEQEDPSLPAEKLLRDRIWNRRCIHWGPTVIIGKAIPVILLLAWSLGLVISIFVKFFTIVFK